jgi:hypothetical protein
MTISVRKIGDTGIFVSGQKFRLMNVQLSRANEVGGFKRWMSMALGIF